MTRRGPDRRRIWCDGAIGLGHALLRVTAEDTFDEQPLIDRDTGISLVADLRLDNREALADLLAIDEAALPRLSDSALLMAAYRKWGEDCAEHLVGDFAFAIWDARSRKLVLGRDHMGARYVHFYRGTEFFVFATEMKGLWACADVPRRLNELHFGNRLAIDFSLTGGATNFEDVFGLLPATVLTVTDNGELRSRRYWEPHADPLHAGRDEAYYIETYRRVLVEAVACRLRRNVKPTALMFSGGFDSAAIAALAGPVMSLQGRKLIAVSSVMADGYRGPIRDARKWVETCARNMPHLDVRYVETRIGPLDDLENDFLLTNGGAASDRVAAIPLFRAAAESGARVLMDGHGGDYTLNPRTQGWLASQLRHGRLRAVFSELLAYRRNREVPFSSVLKSELIWPMLPASARRLWQRFRGGLPPNPRQVLNSDFLQSVLAKSRPLPRFKRGGMSAMIFALARIQDAAQLATSPMAAAYGLEFTQPFHDKRVIELALAIPQLLYVRNGRQRYLARKALAGLFPPEFLTRPDGNISRSPDFFEVAARAQPQLLAELARMEKKERLRRYFDFTRIREMLIEPINPRFRQYSEMRVRQAIRAIIMARFIEWSERRNNW